MIRYDDTLVRAHIVRAWIAAEYDALDKWVMQCDNAVWDYNGPRSHYKGRLFYSYVIFDSTEDLLACKLVFPEIDLVRYAD